MTTENWLLFSFASFLAWGLGLFLLLCFIEAISRAYRAVCFRFKHFWARRRCLWRGYHTEHTKLTLEIAMYSFEPISHDNPEFVIRIEKKCQDCGLETRDIYSIGNLSDLQAMQKANET